MDHTIQPDARQLLRELEAYCRRIGADASNYTVVQRRDSLTGRLSYEIRFIEPALSAPN